MSVLVVGAEIIKFNGIDFEQVIKGFPETKEWIANKILAGRYNEPRILSLKIT